MHCKTSGTFLLFAATMLPYIVLVNSISFSAKNHIPAWHNIYSGLTDAMTLCCQELNSLMFPNGKVKAILNHNNHLQEKHIFSSLVTRPKHKHLQMTVMWNNCAIEGFWRASDLGLIWNWKRYSFYVFNVSYSCSMNFIAFHASQAWTGLWADILRAGC